MRALVVDDERDVRELIGRVLVLAGIEVAYAEDGSAALQYLRRSGPPDVVVLDVQMPRMDGWATLEAIRGESLTKDIPVILCTVKGSRLDVERGWSLGCDAYLTKPFDIDVLVGTVQGVAGRRSGGRKPGSSGSEVSSAGSGLRLGNPRPHWLYSSRG
jgi:DNA-binding response OmpR family regulator